MDIIYEKFEVLDELGDEYIFLENDKLLIHPDTVPSVHLFFFFLENDKKS